MMDVLWVIIGLVVFAFVMGLLVLVHEGGHFLVAKKSGILCHEFSIGMGPIIYQKKKGETVYSIRAFPIGGFVSMAGEEIEENILKDVKKVRLVLDKNNHVEKIIVNLANQKYKNLPEYELGKYDLIGTKDALPDELYLEVKEGEEYVRYIVNRDCLVNFEKTTEIQIAPYDRNFVNKPLLNRFLSVLAGPVMNLVLAVVIFFFIGLFTGYADENNTKIGGVTVVENSNNTLVKGDVITAVNGIKVENWDELSKALNSFENANGPIRVSVDGKDDILINPSVFVYSIEMAFIVDGTNLPIVGSYSSNNTETKAYKAGLREGDLITKIVAKDAALEGANVTKSGIVEFFNSDTFVEGQEVEIYFTRNNEPQNITIEVYSETLLGTQGIPKSKIQLGIECATKFDLLKLIYMPFVQTGESFTMIFKTLGALFTDSSVGVDDLSGPVGIFDLLKNATKNGTLFTWAAIISVNLGFMNLIPLPALDGGRLAFMVYEGITRRKPNAKVENIIHSIGFILLMGLMLYVTFNDVLRCIGCK